MGLQGPWPPSQPAGLRTGHTQRDAMTASTAQARVLLGDRRVGTLHYAQGQTSFVYEDLEPDHPVLGLRFDYDPDYAAHPVTGVPSWFANLLPERESGLRRLYNQQLGRRDTPDFLLLLHLGHDLPGAVRVETEGTLPTAMSEALEEAQLTTHRPKMSFSLSGMQLKFSMTADGDGFRLPAPQQLGDWIIKLPSNVHEQLPANENTMMRWAALAGIDVPEHRLVPLNSLHGLPEEHLSEDGLAFAVSRFDREHRDRIHQEDFAQVLDASPAEKDRGSQELIAQVLLDYCPEDFDEYIRRLVFCVAAGNTDEHLKNWSLRYPDRYTPRLSPAYDLVAVTSYPVYRRDVLTLPIAEQANPRYITRDHFRRFAESLDTDPAPVLRTVDQTVERLHATWPQVHDTPHTPAFVRANIADRLRTLPLLQSARQSSET
ncbi:type II toxin-antitoxin system HipA family toxin [Streptomyces sp. NBC_00258]|uniref:type II toxin-antitoxin system HipA family toxin n=2 Tax=Streptomyces sp. NBC_00258 TaxID=2903642 RepID=UPI002E2E6EE9|nr:type II toxin-antitoxin system HipA family toxin [Streptomyces sp. NBC_00258]